MCRCFYWCEWKARTEREGVTPCEWWQWGWLMERWCKTSGFDQIHPFGVMWLMKIKSAFWNILNCGFKLLAMSSSPVRFADRTNTMLYFILIRSWHTALRVWSICNSGTCLGIGRKQGLLTKTRAVHPSYPSRWKWSILLHGTLGEVRSVSAVDARWFKRQLV